MKCKICARKVTERYLGKGSRDGEEIQIYLCSECKAYFTFPKDRRYDKQNRSLIEYYLSFEGYIKNRQKCIFAEIENRYSLHSGKFLDVGCGMGLSLNVADSLGWTSLGVEPSPTLSQHCQSAGLNVIQDFLSADLLQDNNELADGCFDYILIDNVLEHVPDPKEFLQLTHRLLAKDGILLIAIPPVDWLRLLLVRFSFVRNKIKSSRLNLFYDLEEHVNYFGRGSIRKLIEYSKVGFELDNAGERFHHSRVMTGPIAKLFKLETGYYFIKKISQ